MVPGRVSGPMPERIIEYLGACGHFLHFKMGEKAGRRRIFTILSKQKELPQRQLQDILGICSGSLSEILAKMEADGFLEKAKSQTDGRQLNLRLTESGKREAVELEKDYQRKVRKMVSCLSKEEQESFLKMLKALAECWWDLDQNRDKQQSPVPGSHGNDKKSNE